VKIELQERGEKMSGWLLRAARKVVQKMDEVLHRGCIPLQKEHKRAEKYKARWLHERDARKSLHEERDLLIDVRGRLKMEVDVLRGRCERSLRNVRASMKMVMEKSRALELLRKVEQDLDVEENIEATRVG
jgi:hypothetical protein